MTGMQKFGIIFLLTGFCFVFSAFGNGGAIFDVTMSELLADAEKTDFIPAIIVMKDRHDFEAISQMVKGMPRQERKRVVWEELEAFTDASQEDLIDFLEGEEKLGHIRSIRSLRTINAIAFEAIPDIFIQVAGRRDVIKIAGDPPRPVIPPRIENDPVFGELDEITWSVDQINAPDVWEQGWTGEDIIIAIIDSGVDYDHSDLEDHMWDGGFDFPNHGYNFGDDDDDPMDTNGHGTHVSGIAAGDGTNGTETGVAPDAIIMALKTSLTTDEASQRNVFECHEFALEHGADVTSMSLGWIDAWNPLRDEFRESFDALHEAGIVNIVAAGNEGPGEHSCRTPADVPSPWMNPDETAEGTRGGVITVGASSQNESIAGFSSKGPDEWENVDPFNDWPIGDGGLLLPDVVAPGEGINSTSLGGGYTNMDGTSMAAPSVAGTVCLMLSKSPELLPVEIDSILQATADDRGDEGKDNTWGGGFIDAYEAVDAALAVNGFLQGTVTDMNDDEPLSGVIIELMERNYKDTTDENGNYSMEIVRGLYTLVVNHEPYLFYEDTGIQIDSAEITVADVELRVGLFETDPEVISITLTDNLPQDHILTISNPGSAIINVELEMTPQFEIDDSMDVIENLNVTGITGDAWISGMVYANEVFYVSGANN
ncbi:MAG: S8 family serine peptidase, partial [Candidatus Electryonea clarkiae]|nr:S8 family serine peptidase [Candidatus Electryonea clarkiae]